MREDLVAEIVDEVRDTGGYPVNERTIKRILEAHKGPVPEVLERAFVENFPVSQSGDFQKSLFHYLLNKFGHLKSKIAVEYCFSILRDRPEETLDILEYFKCLNLSDAVTDRLIETIFSEENAYEHQKYQVLKWFLECQINCEAVVDFARLCSSDLNQKDWLRAYAISYLGLFGNTADIDSFEILFTREPSVIVKAHHVEALKRKEISARNTFYGRVEGTDSLLRLAVSYAKSAS